MQKSIPCDSDHSIEQFSLFSKIYDFLAEKSVDYALYADTIIRLVRETGKDHKLSFLDIAGGTGLLSYELSLKCASGHLCDSSAAMLKLARQRLSEIDNIEVVSCDIRNMPVFSSFDFAVIANDSLNYLESQHDLQQCFNSSASNLTSGGILFFDVCTPYYIENLNTHLIAKEILFKNELFTLCHALQANGCTLTIKSQIDDKEFSELHRLYSHTTDTIIKALHQCGFSVSFISDGLSSSSFSHDSKSWYFCCRKI